MGQEGAPSGSDSAELAEATVVPEPSSPAQRPRRRRPTGRRPGDSGTRDAILAAARDRFAASGFEGTTIRAVAQEAGVDPALVHHFFGTKDGLLAAALALPPGLVRSLLDVASGPVDDLGERLVRFYLDLWEDPATGESLRAMFRSAVSHEDAARLLRAFVESQVLRQVAQRVGGDRADLRVTLASSHLVGLAVARYVIGVEPLAGVDRELLVACVAPSVQRYLTGALPDA